MTVTSNPLAEPGNGVDDHMRVRVIRLVRVNTPKHMKPRGRERFIDCGANRALEDLDRRLVIFFGRG